MFDHSPLQLGLQALRKVSCAKPRPDLAPAPEGAPTRWCGCALRTNDLIQLLRSASEDFASGAVHPGVGRALMLATMTALRKEDGVRGIASGLAFWRLVALCPARKFGKEVDAA